MDLEFPLAALVGSEQVEEFGEDGPCSLEQSLSHINRGFECQANLFRLDHVVYRESIEDRLQLLTHKLRSPKHM